MQAKVRKLYDKYQFAFASPGKSCRERTRLTWKCILHCWCIHCNKDWLVVLILRRGKEMKLGKTITRETLKKGNA